MCITDFFLTIVVHSYYDYTKSLYGADIAAAYYILKMKGGFR